MGRKDIENKVLSFKDLEKLGLIDEGTSKGIKQNYKITDINQTYIDLKPLSLYLWYYGGGLENLYFIKINKIL
jgi:hypothetical protein